MGAEVIIGLIWGCLKLFIGNKTVNKALDNWAAGTSNKVDDLLWKLLEAAAGIVDTEERREFVRKGLLSIENTYQSAKINGTLMALKVPTRTWALPQNRQQAYAMLGTGQSSNMA